MLFNETISGWAGWSRVYDSAEAFAPLIEHICAISGLEPSQPRGLTPGTNAVFRVGDTVIKIFAPDETGIDAQSDFDTERFGLSHANARGVNAPVLVASGVVEDRYRFPYIVMDFLPFPELVAIQNALSDGEKEAIGRQLRRTVDALRAPCKRFNDIDAVSRAIGDGEGWDEFPISFQNERLAWLREYRAESLVFTHGDLNADNMLCGGCELYIIDFADALLAPPEYEEALLVCSPFGFEKPYLRGYYGDGYDSEELAELCLRGVLMHDFGDEIIRCHIAPKSEIVSIAELRRRINRRLGG